MKKIIISFIFIITILLTSCNYEKIDTKSIFEFDTVINITLYNDNDANKHINDIKDIFTNISNYASDYKNYNDSSIYDLNTKRSIKSNDVLKDMLNKALELKDSTNGYFNPFIGRLSHIWKDSIKKEALPDDNLIKSEIEVMNNTSLIITDDEIKLNGDGNVDLGAFAKGYVCELVYEYLVENNISEYLIDAGNSMILIGKKNMNVGFRVPRKNDYFAKANVNNIGIATSSSEYQYFIHDGYEYHHIISPFTGYPVNNYDMVCVFSNELYKVDVYSTAIYLMDYDEAVKYSNDNNIKIVLFKNKIIYKSNGCDYVEEIQI